MACSKGDSAFLLIWNIKKMTIATIISSTLFRYVPQFDIYLHTSNSYLTDLYGRLRGLKIQIHCGFFCHQQFY
ncbi:hypothetical protein, partial [Bacillus cereus]|uniref:hypothetical protein n=1 Tax=Bacillus cereus TaxID=1396 RepID=UPI003670C902